MDLHTRFAGGPDAGDFAVGRPADELRPLRHEAAPHPWTWLRQVHGADVVVVETPGHHAGATADAAVTACTGAVLAIHTADCVPVVLHDPQAGVLGVAHAGWRGIVAGVLDNAIDAMVELGATVDTITASSGPHIRARCYEFGAADLADVRSALGDHVVGETAWGTPALDVTTAVKTALADRGVAVTDLGGCTACEPARYFSHRARRDAGRHATLGWLA